MGKAIYTVILDVQSSVSQATLYAKQGDTNRQLHIIFRDGGAPYEISANDLLILSTKTPKDKTIEESVSIVGGEAIYDFSQALAASVGTMNVEIRIYQNGNVILSPTFTLIVDARGDTASDVVAQDSFTALDETYEKVSVLKDGLEEITDQATAAASSAMLAADEANTKAMIAQAAATDADDATKAANEAAEDAQTAINDAKTAAENANNAAVKANEATDKIDTYKTIRREEDIEGGKTFSEVRLEPSKAYLSQGVDWGEHANYTDFTVKDGEANLYRAYEGAEYPVRLTGVATPDGADPTQAVNVQYLNGRSGEVDPVFANNSWELIKWVCQHDDPSKYWKVGDYKMLSFGEKLVATNLTPNTEGWYEGDYVSAKDYGTILAFYDWDKFVNVINGKDGTYTIKAPQAYFASPYYLYDEEGTKIWEGNSFSDLGASIMDVTESPDEWTIVVVNEKYEYPLQIIGFNHDKVTNPYEYGKQRAGMTLQMGCSRNVYGDTKPSLFNGKIDGLMTPNGYYLSPNRVKSDYSLGATNWGESGFRIALQNLFLGSEIEPYMVEVQKYTSQYYNENNHWCAPMLTADKVFLPSEWELFGMKVHAPAQEGEHYEFYKDGYSKYMWHNNMLENKVMYSLLWSRSAQAEQVNTTKSDSISTCCTYLIVNSFDPLSVNYSPAAAANVSETYAGLIAPCICL